MHKPNKAEKKALFVADAGLIVALTAFLGGIALTLWLGKSDIVLVVGAVMWVVGGIMFAFGLSKAKHEAWVAINNDSQNPMELKKWEDK